jgi:hypothetical protein
VENAYRENDQRGKEKNVMEYPLCFDFYPGRFDDIFMGEWISMNFKHFIKTFLIFSFMILVGLLGVFLLNRFDKSKEQTNPLNTSPVAK